MNINEILKAKDLNQIKETIVNSGDKKFSNKDFIETANALYPEKLEQIVLALSMATNHGKIFDIFELIEKLYQGDTIGEFRGLKVLNAVIFLICLCGVNRDNLLVVAQKKINIWDMNDRQKEEHKKDPRTKYWLKLKSRAEIQSDHYRNF